MSLMELFANPETMQNLSMSEKLAGAGITTVMGIGITFVVLILLWGCISFMTKFTYRPNKGDEALKSITEDAAPPLEEVETIEEHTVDESVIAVISAAIAAYEGGSSTLVVRKIRRISGERTAWGDAGRIDCIESRKF